MDTKEVKLPADVMQKTLDYLATRPFNEVAALIQAIMQDHKPVEAPEIKQEKNKK